MRFGDHHLIAVDIEHPQLVPDGVRDDDAYRQHSSMEVQTVGFQEFAPDVESIASVRRFVVSTLEPAGVSRDHIFDCQLIADELATNAVRYAGSVFSVAIELSDTFIRICVRDDSNAWPVAREARPDALGGRGLTLVDGAACGWGFISLGRGKETWADIRDDGLRAPGPAVLHR